MKTSTSRSSPLSPTLWPPDAFVWWRSLGLGLLLFLTTIIPPVLFWGFAIGSGITTLPELRTLSWPVIVGQMIAYACMFAVLVGLLPPLAHRSLVALGLRAPRVSDVYWGVAGALAMVIVAAAAGAAQESIFHLKADEVAVQWLRAARGSLLVGFAVLACIAAPFFEELVFRGFILNALLRYAPAWLGVLLSALIFGGMHYQPGNAGALLPLAAGGVILGLVYYRTGSLVASMLTHAVFNGATVFAVAVLHQS